MRMRMKMKRFAFVLLTVTVCWLGVVGGTEDEDEREDGTLYDHTSLGIRPWYGPYVMRNRDYPDGAPHLLVQTWRYVAMPAQAGPSVAVSVTCNRLFIPKMEGREECGEYKMTLDDGEERRELCGDLGEFRYLSTTTDIKFELHTSHTGGAIVDCLARAVLITPDRQIITTTTTTTPKPTRPAYLSMGSEEVDSTEHGGGEGPVRTSCPCGWANKEMSRIVNGTETARNEFPFAAGLSFRGNRYRFCGATIITKYHALTAAHCTIKYKPQWMALLVGIHNILQDVDGSVDEINVERFINHENYNGDTFTDDISLLILERPIEFNRFVGPACLPQAQPAALQRDREYIKIIGWGAEVFMGEQSAVLKKVDVRVVPMKECNHMYPNVQVHPPKQICTYRKMKASCQGDSGGPVMWLDNETNRYTHVGIVSFGRICGDISPSVHTRVQAYLHWIHHHIKASDKPHSETCSKIN